MPAFGIVLAALKSILGSVFGVIGNVFSFLFKNPIYIAFIVTLVVGLAGGYYFEKWQSDKVILAMQQSDAKTLKERDDKIAQLESDSKEAADASGAALKALQGELSNTQGKLADAEDAAKKAKKIATQQIEVNKQLVSKDKDQVDSKTGQAIVELEFENGHQICSRFSDEFAVNINQMIDETNVSLTVSIPPTVEPPSIPATAKEPS